MGSLMQWKVHVMIGRRRDAEGDVWRWGGVMIYNHSETEKRRKLQESTHTQHVDVTKTMKHLPPTPLKQYILYRQICLIWHTIKGKRSYSLDFTAEKFEIINAFGERNFPLDTRSAFWSEGRTFQGEQIEMPFEKFSLLHFKSEGWEKLLNIYSFVIIQIHSPLTI